MLYHYIKIAFRNLLKYKLQSFIVSSGSQSDLQVSRYRRSGYDMN